MKAILFAAFLLLVAKIAFADIVMICTDATGSQCHGSIPQGLQQLVVIHKYSPGAVASRFTINVTAAPGAQLLAFQTEYSASGQLGSEQTVLYNTCMTASIVIGTLYLVMTCGEIRIAPATAVDCSFVEHAAWDNIATALCSCTGTSRCFPVPTEPSTWGSVKALYRE